MYNKNTPKELKEKRSAVEKPVSLWGAPFAEVVKTLLNTKPMPKEDKQEKEQKQQL
jgi:hypothetical protein